VLPVGAQVASHVLLEGAGEDWEVDSLRIEAFILRHSFNSQPDSCPLPGYSDTR